MSALQSIALKESWKKRNAFTNGMAGTKLNNVWRAFRFTVKGKNGDVVKNGKILIYLFEI